MYILLFILMSWCLHSFIGFYINTILNRCHNSNGHASTDVIEFGLGKSFYRGWKSLRWVRRHSNCSFSFKVYLEYKLDIFRRNYEWCCDCFYEKQWWDLENNLIILWKRLFSCWPILSTPGIEFSISYLYFMNAVSIDEHVPTQPAHTY